MISVIVPIHNTDRYLDECLYSIANQTYTDLEVLCIDSSTDGSPDIIREYCSRDSRFKLISDSNRSYGYKVNLGISLAKGEYIGLIDSDDYIEPEMYEKAIEAIEEYAADFVKYDFKMVTGSGENKKYIYRANIADEKYYADVFNAEKFADVFYLTAPAIWACLYSRQFILDNNIRLLESEGAGFQDISFSVLTHLFAKRIKYMNEAYYCYRIDNADCSCASEKNAFHIIAECKYFEELASRYQHLTEEQKTSLTYKKIATYAWNYERLKHPLAYEFAARVRDKIMVYYKNGFYEAMPLRIKNSLDEMYYSKKIDGKKVSVVIPVYNQEKYLENTILSVRIQSFRNVEIICVDDGSTDSSAEIIKRAQKEDGRIKYISQKHKGTSYTRNHGAKIATGDYLLFLDGDDRLHPEAIKRLVCLAEKHNCEAVEFDAECIFEDEALFDEYKVNYYLRKKSYKKHSGKKLFTQFVKGEDWLDSMCTVLLNREHYMKEGLRFKEGILFEDCQLWPLLHSRLNSVYHTAEKLYLYNVHQNSTMTSEATAFNIYSRVKCYMSNLKLIAAETEDMAFKAALETLNLRMLTAIKVAELSAGFYNSMEITDYGLSKKEIEVLERADVKYQLYRNLKELVELFEGYDTVTAHCGGETYAELKAFLSDNRLFQRKFTLLPAACGGISEIVLRAVDGSSVNYALTAADIDALHFYGQQAASEGGSLL